MGMPAIFLDRDGVLNENRPDHVKSWAEFRFLPGTFEALHALSRLGLPLVVITNQAIVNRGQVARGVVEEIHARMVGEVRRAGVELAAVLACPHRPDEGCGCRKPAPGLLLEAATRYNLDLARSVLIGDAESDIAAGQQVGCRTILVLTGRGDVAARAFARGEGPPPTAIVPDLRAAVPVVARYLQPEARPAAD